MRGDSCYMPGRVAPLPDDAGPIRFLQTLVAHPVASIPAAAYREAVVIPNFARSKLAFITDPVILEEILVRRVGDFPKSVADERVLRPAFGNGLLLADGESWRWKRRLVSPFFTPTALEDLIPTLAAPFQFLVWKWRGSGRSCIVDVVPAMTAATLQVITNVLFSEETRLDMEAISGAINDYFEPLAWVVGFACLKIPPWVPFPGRRRIERGRNRMRALVHRVLAERRRSNLQAHDLCSQLMQARDPETGRTLSNEDLVDMLLTLIVAGHETTVSGLCWAVWCLAGAPELQASLVQEIEEIAGSGPIEPDLLPHLSLTKAFLMETLRLFPPAPLLARRTIKSEFLGGHHLRVGTTLSIPTYAIHRHERLWRDPHRFDLSRFLDGQDKLIGRTTYLPFGAGPRTCLGASFAMTELTVALATLLQSVRFRMVEGSVADPGHRMTLRPKGGLLVGVDVVVDSARFSPRADLPGWWNCSAARKDSKPPSIHQRR
jgi:cytochrome P450